MDTVYWVEKQVENKVNGTNLQHIIIKGLFGRYNINISFDKEVNIFIGENGLGKTTILNCIYYVLEKQFSRLSGIQFAEMEIKFRKSNKPYKISISDLMAYDRDKRLVASKYETDHDPFLTKEYIDNFLYRYDSKFYRLDVERDIDALTYEVARNLDVPLRVARNRVMHYINDRDMFNNYLDGNGERVTELIKAISENVTHRIIYLPTYRRIEDDFSSLNLRNEELNRAELLIRFGMSDVQSSIDRILEKIRSIAMKGFTDMTGVLLKQYADGEDPIKESISRRKYGRIDYETVKIVLDRVGKAIEESYKQKILQLVYSEEIDNYEYLYLKNLIIKLTDNYDAQKAYDDRIKRFTDTCNKYLIDKRFVYNQSTLSLDIFLDSELKKSKKNKKRDTIQLTQLSSGEKQIVSLFSKLYLESDERSIVIIDEPELSLSLQWQKMLLPDIMRTENCDLLLTVTHSPFIFENEFDDDAQEVRGCITPYNR